MYNSENELKNEVRQFTGYTSDLALSQIALNTAYKRAKRRIRRSKTLEDNFDWFNSDKVAAQDALFWFTCLYVKVETGELDSPGMQAGAVDLGDMLSDEDGTETRWYNEARMALKNVNPDSIIKASRPARTGRSYEAGSFGEQSGGSGTEIDNTDI